MQKALFATSSVTPKAAKSGTSVRLLALNLQNPSRQRATSFIGWLANQPQYDLLVLSELTDKPPVHHLFAELEAMGYNMAYSVPNGPDRYFTAIASVMPLKRHIVETKILFGRTEIISLRDPSEVKLFFVVGLYGKTCGPGPSEERHSFQAALEEKVLRRLGSGRTPTLVVGDLNIVEEQYHSHLLAFDEIDRNHYDAYARHGFVDIARQLNPDDPHYTWHSPFDGGGQRLDHAFISLPSSDAVSNVTFIHETRRDGLSDHSGLAIEFWL